MRDQMITQGCFVVTEVNFDVVQALIDWIISNRPKHTEFQIVINSSGGDPGAIVYLASSLRTLSSDVRIIGVAFGECGSAALALFQLCHIRYAVLNTGFFIHTAGLQTTVGCENYDHEALKERLADTKRTQDELVDIQCRRTGLTIEKWQELAARGDKDPGTPIFVREAKKLGLVDHVLTRLNLF
jgi:ATP-dependent protease ClpP protease subunit